MSAVLEEDGDHASESEFWEAGARYRQIGGRSSFTSSRWNILAVLVGVAGLCTLMLKPSPGATRSSVPDLVRLVVSQEEEPPPFAPLVFCWAMVRVAGYEPEILSAQYYNKAGIFACDSHAVYSTGGIAHVGPVQATEVVADKSNMGNLKKAGTATDSWLNTMTFIRAWEMVIDEGLWWTNDWTVKVDPDAVFFPDRLRKKVESHTGGLNAQPLWVGNCDRVWHNSKPHLKLFGSLEVFSRNAIGTYKAFGDTCRKDLPWHGWGEDMFMQECMKQLKIEAINGTDYLGDKRCYDAPCTDIHRVAFHDFKAVGPFFECWGQSKGSEKVFKQEQDRLKKLTALQKREREEAVRVAQAELEANRLKEENRLKASHLRERIKKNLRKNESMPQPMVAPPLPDVASNDESAKADEKELELFIRKRK